MSNVISNIAYLDVNVGINSADPDQVALRSSMSKVCTFFQHRSSPLRLAEAIHRWFFSDINA